MERKKKTHLAVTHIFSPSHYHLHVPAFSMLFSVVRKMSNRSVVAQKRVSELENVVEGVKQALATAVVNEL
jgi:hypothetical protein